MGENISRRFQQHKMQLNLYQFIQIVCWLKWQIVNNKKKAAPKEMAKKWLETVAAWNEENSKFI